MIIYLYLLIITQVLFAIDTEWCGCEFSNKTFTTYSHTCFLIAIFGVFLYYILNVFEQNASNLEYN